MSAPYGNVFIMNARTPHRLAAAAALAGMIFTAGCSATVGERAATPTPSRTVPTAPPAADLSDIDRYIDADPFKELAIEGWIVATANRACSTNTTDQALQQQVTARGEQAAKLGRSSAGRVIRTTWSPTTLPATKVDAGPIPVLAATGESWCGYRDRLDVWTAARKAAPIVDGDFVDKLTDSDPMKPLALQAWINATAKLQCSTRRDDPETRSAAVRRAQVHNTILPRNFPNDPPTPVLADGQDWCSYATALATASATTK